MPRATGDWTVGSLGGRRHRATLTVDVSVDAAGDYTNTASISHSDQFDPVGANNTASAQVWTAVADIAIAKSVDKPAPPVGSAVKFTITATNAGPDPASQLVVEDALTADFVFVSATPSQGSYDSAGGTGLSGGLAVDGRRDPPDQGPSRRLRAPREHRLARQPAPARPERLERLRHGNAWTPRTRQTSA